MEHVHLLSALPQPDDGGTGGEGGQLKPDGGRMRPTAVPRNVPGMGARYGSVQQADDEDMLEEAGAANGGGGGGGGGQRQGKPGVWYSAVPYNPSNGGKNKMLIQKKKGEGAAGAAEEAAEDGGEGMLPVVVQEKKPGMDWVSFAVLALNVLIGDTARGIMFPTLWPFVVSLGGDRVAQGFCVAGFSFGRILSSPVLGWASTMYGYRWVLVATDMVLVVGTLMYAFAWSIPSLLAAQVIMGCGSGALGAQRAAVAEQATKENRTALLGALTAVQYSGFTVMPLLGGALSEFADRNSVNILGLSVNSYSVPAFFMTVLAVIAIILLITHFKDYKRAPASQGDNNNNDPQKGTPQPQQQPSGLGLLDVLLGGGLMLNFVTKGTIACFETLGAAYAIAHYSYNSLQAGYTFATFGALGVCVLLCFRWLCRYVSDVNLVLGGMLLMIASPIMLTHFPNQSVPLWRFLVAIFLMYSASYPIGHTAVLGMFSNVVSGANKAQGIWLGWFGSAGSAARVFFPIVAGILTQYYGDASIFILMTCVLIVGWIFVFTMRDAYHIAATRGS